MNPDFRGAGPGAQTPDGCSVEFYRRLPYMDELRDIEADLARHASALELGCGTGRLCARMQSLGLAVAGVDESADMLALLPAGVEGFRSSIETLDLGRRWPAVLLPSHLINHPDDALRRRFVDAARRHLAPGGVFYVKRHDTGWLSSVQEGFLGEANGVAYHAEGVVRRGRQLSMTLRYLTSGAAWTQSFVTTALDTTEIEALLSSCGLECFTWFGDRRLWVGARTAEA